jgi:hypothetical protein
MPIRFRCAYCNQLMGIARRKAGTVVRCPTCAGQVVVPSPGPGVEELQKPGPGPALFERSDFNFEQEIHKPPAGESRTAGARQAGFAPVPPAPAPARPGGHDAPAAAGASLSLQSLPTGTPTPGILLTPGKATLLGVVIVILLGVAFFAGMLVGRS